jgi:hypothetical protein
MAMKLEQTKNTSGNMQNQCNILNKHKPKTWLDTKARRNVTQMKHLEASNVSKGKQCILLEHTCTYDGWLDQNIL